MRCGWLAPRKAIIGVLLAGTAASLVPVSAEAQDDTRLRKIEAEIRALQRQVFPGSDGRFFTPEVDTSQPQAAIPSGTPSTSALTDVLARLNAIEAQLAQLTARAEENAHVITLLQERVDLALPQSTVPAVAAQPAGVIQPPAQGPEMGAAQQPAAPALTRPAQVAVGPAPAPVRGPSAERIAAVMAIAKPVSDDKGEDEYTYGFRLWDAKLFPEARQQISLYLEQFPNHSRVSYARNLLGRAYLDDGQPREAANAFLQNYQSNKNGARAPDSLLFLAEAMIGLGDTNRACIALAEFGDNYPALAMGRLQSQYDRNRGRVTCN